MNEKLLNMSAGDLLHAFGTGGHNPGSGSAAAHMGSLAAQLTSNVIDLTELYKKRSVTYQAHLGLFRSHLAVLRTRIIPALDRYTEQDSAQFERVIKARQARNEEKDPKLKQIKSKIADDELRVATELPIEIARYCYNVGRMAAEVFDYGYTAARGESAEGIIFASASMLSCLSIIELNLQKLPVDEWTDKIRKQKEKLYGQHRELEELGKQRHSILKKEADEHYEFEVKKEHFRTGNLADKILTDQQLEKLVHDLHVFIWRNKQKIWKKESNAITEHRHILKPQDILLHVMDYKVLLKDSLGRHYEGTEAFDVAGFIDKRNRRVEISRQFNEDTMRFTAAHELGHALLHRGTVLHRDRPIDGSKINRNPIERQADKFAALFLMPAKMVRLVFEEVFEAQVFHLNDKTAFKLGISSVLNFQENYKGLRELSRFLATCRRFDDKKFTPLAVMFGVSDETMAIRLEELGLIDMK
jgi:Zn-dependent peptidase ImmA (M78 family)/formiminotetrahydrofolate cyclodeaminase